MGNSKKAGIYEKIFAWQAPAIIDEMGFGRDPYGMMHHKLFARQVYDTTGITERRLIGNPLKVMSNTLLRDEIQRSFNEVVSGLCMMYTVETIAPELFATQEKIFLAAGAPIEKLLHSSLHKKLEIEHAQEAEEWNTLLTKIASDTEIKTLIQQDGKVWKNFLDDVHHVIITEK